jgi:hypothetical protein
MVAIEQREGNVALPEIDGAEKAGVGMPLSGRLSARNANALAVLAEDAGHPFQQVWRIPAVIVRESNQVSRGVTQANIIGFGVPALRGANVRDPEFVAIMGDELLDAVVIILIDDDGVEIPERLRAQGVEKTVQLAFATDSREDKGEVHIASFAGDVSCCKGGRSVSAERH